MTERLHFHFSLSCIGEGNGNPLQYSCLENPRDRGAWWAAVCRVAQSWTRLKWLSIGLQHTWSLSITNSRKLISCPLSWWCHPTISSSVVPFSSCFQSFPVSGTFLMSHFFTSGGQSIGASASASVLPISIQDWFPLGLTGLISLQSKGLSRVFSNTTV